MPSLKDLRNRIATVKSTQKITKAMQMVAASKLRRAQAAAEAARPFADKVETVLSNLAGASAVPLGDLTATDGVATDSAGTQGRDGERAVLRIRARRGRDPGATAAAGCDGARLSRVVGEYGLVLRRADERDGQRDPQRRRN